MAMPRSRLTEARLNPVQADKPRGVAPKLTSASSSLHPRQRVPERIYRCHQGTAQRATRADRIALRNQTAIAPAQAASPPSMPARQAQKPSRHPERPLAERPPIRKAKHIEAPTVPEQSVHLVLIAELPGPESSMSRS